MDKLIITGGARLQGEIAVSGAKNAALPMLVATLMADDASTVHNVPALQDVATMCELLNRLGGQVERTATGSVTVRPPPRNLSDDGFVAPYDLVRTMRASILVLGPLLTRFGHVKVSMPGGCAIGARPIDYHLRGLEALGATIELTHGYVECRAKRLRGAQIVLDMPSVTGTENLLMAATLAEGDTLIENAAREPEIVALAQMLNDMGAKIEGAGTSVVRVSGVDRLAPVTCTVLPDRIEAGTFLVAGAITGGELFVRNARASDLDAVIAKLRSAGAIVKCEKDGVLVRAERPLTSVDITTQPHPGFPTDMQAQFVTLATQANGQSVVNEMIFENRFMHVPELQRMGADIRLSGHAAMIRGGRRLSGTTVMATDLRASASLVLAGLVADGETHVRRVYHLDRGYEKIETKLSQVGANIRRSRE